MEYGERWRCWYSLAQSEKFKDELLLPLTSDMYPLLILLLSDRAGVEGVDAGVDEPLVPFVSLSIFSLVFCGGCLLVFWRRLGVEVVVDRSLEVDTLESVRRRR